MSAVRKWGGDGLFEAVGGWDNDLARDPPPRVSRSGRVLCAPSFAIYIIIALSLPILLKGFMKKSQYYGCYVGQTKTTKLDNYSDNQTARLSQHFQGIRASKKVQVYGSFYGAFEGSSEEATRVYNLC